MADNFRGYFFAAQCRVDTVKTVGTSLQTKAGKEQILIGLTVNTLPLSLRDFVILS